MVIFHAFPKLLRGGFIGVDVFFVISGFLISTIIMGSLERNSFSFIEFYSRRIKRIFPALILVLSACLAFGWFALLADEYKQLGKHIAGGAGFISNFLFWNESGYFDNAAETKPLLHLWSLGIEEQFYIVWPLLLWVVWKKRFNLLTITLIVALISFALNIRQIRHDEIAAFYSPQTRFWELLIGSVLAYLTLHRQSLFPKLKHRLDGWLGKVIYAQAPEVNGKTLHNVQSLLGAFFILAGVLIITKERHFPGWWALLPTLGAVLIISAGVHAWFNRVVLSNGVLVWFGLISFPLYLWHWPLLSFARIMESDTPSRGIRLAAIVIAIVLAWLTYRFVERPVRLGRYGQAKTVGLIVLMIIVAGVGFTTYRQNGFEFRHVKQELIIANTPFEWPKEMGHQIECAKKFGNGYCHVKNIDRHPTMLLVGDSHSEHLYPGLANMIADQAVNIINSGSGGCLPFFNVESIQKGGADVCSKIINRALTFALETESVNTVILSSRGPLYLTGKGFHVDGDGEDLHDRALLLTNKPRISSYPEIFKIAMRNSLEQLTAENKKIIFVLDVPELGFDPKSCIDIRPLRLTSKHVKSPCAVSKQSFDERNREYRTLVLSVLKDFPEVRVFDAAAQLCDDQWCWAIKDGKMLYRDDDHLSLEGSDFIAKALIREIEISSP